MTTEFSINLQDVSKRYGYDWIFRHINYTFSLGQVYAIRGHNGSGKSTLLRILSAMESPNKGQRIYRKNEELLNDRHVASNMSYAAPYMDLPGHLTVKEIIAFHASFKKMCLTEAELLTTLNLDKSKDQPIEYLSSGQQQKIKLALTIFNHDPLLLLDEPGSNLDDDNYAWFAKNLRANMSNKLICIATNERRDLDLCSAQLDIEDFKN